MPIRSLDSHITSTPETCGGKPRVANRRITVQNIAVWHERLGLSPDEIAAEYDLTLADIHAALAYYHDHRAEMDASIEADNELAESLRQATASKLRDKLRGCP